MDRNPCTTNVQVAPEYSEHEVRKLSVPRDKRSGVDQR